MLKIAQVREYSEHIKQAIPEIKVCYHGVVKENLMKFMQNHSEEENTLMMVLIPDHRLSGDENEAQWENKIGYFFMEKTDYSEHDPDGYLSIFERTQEVANLFVHKLLEDKADNTGLFCGFLAWLNENAIGVLPIVSLNGCNGYYVEISLKSNL